MKHTFILLLTLLTTSLLFGQVPQKMNYQAVIRNSSNALITNTVVGMRISLLQGSATGTPVYVETQNTSTNDNGLLTIEIGGGTSITGTMAGINWGNTPYYIKTETDPTGGTNYSITGTSQLLSVPYSFLAGGFVSTSGNTLGDEVISQKETNFAFTDASSYKVYVYNTKASTWTSQSYTTGAQTPSIISSNGNFAFTDASGYKVYVYNAKTNTWSSQVYTNGAQTASIVNSNGNFAFTDASGYKVYVYNAKNGTWSFQSYTNGAQTASIVNSNGNFAFTDASGYRVYVYDAKNSTWSFQSYTTGAQTASIVNSNGNFAFTDASGYKVYAFSAKMGIWSSQSYTTGAQTASIKISETN